jgi:diguanylate cyclase (GGDEF)-like protein
VTSEAALALGERVRRQIATHVENADTRVTVSIGVATTASGEVDYDSLFQLADRCLYQAKAAGRNCTIGDRVASSEAPVRLVYSN